MECSRKTQMSFWKPIATIESYEVPTHLAKEDSLDVGCGYDPMGLSFAKANPQMSEMVDGSNERA